ncbi:MAG: polymorphic toxin type 50 domain-containing protein [Peptococcaceae bacterium]|nr:polymorphic toxin type 50 domain-containing protein [Peptococcaceae bacterium]
MCGEHRNGLVAPIDEIGGDTPPVHGRCRCVLSPVFSSLQPQKVIPEVLDWSDVAPLPKGWVPDDAPTASGKVFAEPGKTTEQLVNRTLETRDGLREDQRQRIESGEYSTKVQWSKQDRHSPGTREYRQYVKKIGHEPSYFTVNQKKLFADYIAPALTKGRLIVSGLAFKESLDLSKIGHIQPVGIWYNEVIGISVPTTWVMVVYSTKGIHFYPKGPDAF